MMSDGLVAGAAMTTQDYINEEIQRERDAQYRASAQSWAMQQQMQQAGNSLMQAAMNQASRPSEVILLRAKVRELTDQLAGERERCAKAAEDEFVDAEATGAESDIAYNEACRDVAARIRSGK